MKTEGATGEAERLVQVKDLWPAYPERPTQTQAGGVNRPAVDPFLLMLGRFVHVNLHTLPRNKLRHPNTQRVR